MKKTMSNRKWICQQHYNTIFRYDANYSQVKLSISCNNDYSPSLYTEVTLLCLIRASVHAPGATK